ncbi:MAG: type II toxin-antitoxin system PemK/MazF family toxin [Lachnospiraceae bacterium]
MCRYGDIYIADRNLTDNLHKLKQTVLVVSEDRTNKVSSIVNVVPIVDAAEQDELQTYVFIGNYGMAEENIAVVEQITTLDKSQILVKVGGIQGTVYAGQVKNALRKHLNL